MAFQPKTNNLALVYCNNQVLQLSFLLKAGLNGTIYGPDLTARQWWTSDLWPTREMEFEFARFGQFVALPENHHLKMRVRQALRYFQLTNRNV